jgi:SAM-dependent methyltransferase
MVAAQWRPDDYARHAGFVPALGQAALDLLAPQPGERVLDLGCGDGVLTARIADAGAEVLGVDADPAMLDAARARGLSVQSGDGQALAFVAEFDAVFSNAAVHWMPDHAAVSASVFRALKPGGRFVGEMGGHGNIAAIRTAIRAVLGDADPERNRYPTPDDWGGDLTTAGFERIETWLLPRPTPLPTGIRGWLTGFRGPLFAEAGEHAAERVEALLAPALRDRSGAWTADYVRLRWRALKPAVAM